MAHLLPNYSLKKRRPSVKILKAAIGDSNVSKIWLRRGEAMDISVAIDVVEAGQLCALMWSNTGQNTDTRIRVILQDKAALSYRHPTPDIEYCTCT
jgi:hypothetical protein